MFERTEVNLTPGGGYRYYILDNVTNCIDIFCYITLMALHCFDRL